MKTLLLCDEGCMDFDGVSLLEQTEDVLKKAGFTVKSREIRGSEFKSCMGCFGCWTKTPGLCVLPGDKANEINSEVINSQLLVLITHIQYGSYSADTKKYMDRIIPNISPFFQVINGETHHHKRYKNYPGLAVIGYGTEIFDSEERTFKALVKRNSINLHAPQNISLVIKDKEDITEEMATLSNFVSEVIA